MHKCEEGLGVLKRFRGRLDSFLDSDWYKFHQCGIFASFTKLLLQKPKTKGNVSFGFKNIFCMDAR